MATASRAKVRNDQSVAVTWYAASGTSPSPAATHVVSTRTPRSASVRTSSGTPPRAAASTRPGWARSGTRVRPASRTSTDARASAMPVWAITVPHADPAMPHPRPWTNQRLSSALVVNPATATTSGVRVSCRPRSTPVVASTTSIDGMPKAETRR